MQNGFCHPDGVGALIGKGLAGVDQAVANTVLAINRARQAQWPIVFTRHSYRHGYVGAGRNFYRAGRRLREAEGLLRGTWDADLLSEMSVLPDDLIVDKTRYDAFLGTPFEMLLRDLEVTDLVLAGVVTNVCVECTARAAYMRDFGVTVLADCCAASSHRLHEISLEVMDVCGFATIAYITGGFVFAT